MLLLKKPYFVFGSIAVGCMISLPLFSGSGESGLLLTLAAFVTLVVVQLSCFLWWTRASRKSGSAVRGPVLVSAAAFIFGTWLLFMAAAQLFFRLGNALDALITAAGLFGCSWWMRRRASI